LPIATVTYPGRISIRLLGLWVGKQIDLASAVAYIVAQLLGGIVAALVLNFLIGSVAPGLGATVLADGVTPVQGLLIETILTFFLANAVFNSAVSGQAGNAAPVAIGLTLTASILMAGPLTGGSLNPARTIGPAVATGNFADLWVYLVGPIVGAVLAAILYNSLLRPAS
jgi:aquaporin Z